MHRVAAALLGVAIATTVAMLVAGAPWEDISGVLAFWVLTALLVAIVSR